MYLFYNFLMNRMSIQLKEESLKIVNVKIIPLALSSIKILSTNEYQLEIHCFYFIIVWYCRLDNFLGNSILSQSLTILSGPPGIGKTQFFISIICWCIENGKHVVYISTGCDFVLERVLQILQVHQIKQLEILKLLHIVHISTYQECISCFEDFEDVYLFILSFISSYFKPNNLVVF